MLPGGWVTLRDVCHCAIDKGRFHLYRVTQVELAASVITAIHQRKAGVESAPSLAFWWHDPGKMRTPTQRGGKGRGKLWRQTRQVERHPVVTDAELIAMTYPSEANNVGSTRRSRLQRRPLLAQYVLIACLKAGISTSTFQRPHRCSHPSRSRLGSLP